MFDSISLPSIDEMCVCVCVCDSLTPEVSIESLQPELYAQTSIESMEGSSMDPATGPALVTNGDVDLHFDGPIESTPLGQIHFALIYDDHKKALMVKIVEACHLPLPKPSESADSSPPVAQQPETGTHIPSSSSSSVTPSRHHHHHRKDPPHSNP